jgi:hypothetical protein
LLSSAACHILSAYEQAGESEMTSVAIGRGALPVVLAILITSVWIVARRADVAAQTATTTTYTRTYLGLDFRPLDAVVFPELASNSGGGIYPIAIGNNINNLPDQMYFEARVDLPVGAKVTEVTFFVCGPSGNAKFYFGAYRPNTRTFTAALPEANPPVSTQCPAGTRAFTRTGSPIVTTTAGFAYHLGVHILAIGNFRLANPIWVLNGARVRYTCTATSCT